MIKNYRNIYLPQFSSRLFTFYLIPEGYGFVDSYLSSPVSFMLPIQPRFYSTSLPSQLVINSTPDNIVFTPENSPSGKSVLFLPPLGLLFYTL